MLQMVKETDQNEVLTLEAETSWTKEQEREAFLHTSRVNAAKAFAKYL